MVKALKLLAIVVLMGALFFSCKKKKNTSEEEEPQITSVPTTSYTPFYFYGSFEHNLARGDSSATAYFGTIAFGSAVFYDLPFTGGSASSFIDGGPVSINGFSFVRNYVGGYTYYSIPSSTVPTSPSHWSSVGNGTVPAINITDDTPWPTYSGKNVLPDTVKTGFNNVILIQGVSGADEIQVNLASGPNWFQKVYPISTDAVFVTPIDLSVLTPWNPGFMQIILRKKTIVIINSKPYQFVKAYTWNHTVYYK